MINQKRSGFTLIEILVVVTIIALLTAIGMVSYASANRNSRDAKRLTDVEQIRAALEMYRADQGGYPLLITFGDPLSYGSNTYMSRIPQDPKDPSYSYSYTYNSANDYTLTIYSEKEGENRCFGPLGEKDC